MSTISLRQGKIYEATLSLGLLQSFASNDLIGEKFRELGFTDISVTGDGGTRTAVGRWSQADMTTTMPPEVASVTEVEAQA